jgi:hypothetical protein
MLGMIGSALGAIAGGAMGINQTHQQYQYQKELMEQQQGYNKELGHINQGYALQMQGKNAQTAKELAGLSHQYNKEMYDYTGIQSQMAQMKAAGLNPALMYGQVGAGASTAGGSVGSGSGSAGSAPSGGAPQAPQSQAIAGIGMGMQLGNIMADIDLKKSQADLNEAEADKKRGIDTALAKAQEELTRANIDVANMSVEEIASKAKMYGDASVKLYQDARKAAAEANYAEETMNDRVKQAGFESTGSLLKNIETIAKTKLTEEQAKAIGENLAIAWYNAKTGRMNATTAADHVANELFKTTGELDIKQKQLLKDWIYQGIHAGVSLLEGVTDLVKVKALIKAAAKGVKEVIRKQHNKEGEGDWNETWVKEIFKE